MAKTKPEKSKGVVEHSRTSEDFDEALAYSEDASTAFFELANCDEVRLTVGRSGARSTVLIKQGPAEHTGGIVWETAFFLTKYLEQHVLPYRGRHPHVVEVGAGCGLLGISLAHLGCNVILTDQTLAMASLETNVRYNKERLPGLYVSAMPLCWGNRDHIAAVSAHRPFDMLVATDVVYIISLVEPLLYTMASLLERDDNRTAEAWLCVQEREPEAHAKLLALAPNDFFVEEKSFRGLPGYEAAVELDCVLLRLRLRPDRPRNHVQTLDVQSKDANYFNNHIAQSNLSALDLRNNFVGSSIPVLLAGVSLILAFISLWRFHSFLTLVLGLQEPLLHA